MGNYLYLTIEHSTRRPMYTSYAPRKTTSQKSPNRTDDFLRRNCTPPTLATCWEMLIVSFCSLITTSYTLHNELRVSISTLQLETPAD